jgi:cytochrome o ubiquinol oxidase subunit 2
MNSFFVPQLGSQIYTMAGMVTQLSLQADRPGIYYGLSAQFSGDGFSDMGFQARALPQADFDSWVAAAKGGKPLDTDAYAALAEESKAVKPETYRAVDPDLFDRIVAFTAPPADASPQGPQGPIQPRPKGE